MKLHYLKMVHIKKQVFKEKANKRWEGKNNAGSQKLRLLTQDFVPRSNLFFPNEGKQAVIWNKQL